MDKYKTKFGMQAAGYLTSAFFVAIICGGVGYSMYKGKTFKTEAPIAASATIPVASTVQDKKGKSVENAAATEKEIVGDSYVPNNGGNVVNEELKKQKKSQWKYIGCDQFSCTDILIDGDNTNRVMIQTSSGYTSISLSGDIIKGIPQKEVVIVSIRGNDEFGNQFYADYTARIDGESAISFGNTIPNPVVIGAAKEVNVTVKTGKSKIVAEFSGMN